MTPILTTHVGSLPRGDELAQLLLARDHGQPVDPAHFEQVVQTAIDHAVQKQVEVGVGVMSDGELGKVGYATYITERLEGFGGHIDRTPAKDLADFPELRKKLSAIMGSQEFVRAACIGPVKLRTLEPCHDDIRRFKSAIEQHGQGGRGFMNAASPGLITAFQPNQHYPTHEAYLADLVEAMRPEYEAIVAAGFDLQLDCPDLAMAAHTGFQNLSEAEFTARAWQNVEALNAATRNIPSEKLRMHICWGNYEGPHHCDIALEKVIDPILAAKPSTILFEAANPRHEHEWEIWRDAKLADDKILAPGLIDSCSNYVEHPELIRQRLERYVGFMGRDRVLASTDCGFGTFANYGKIDPAVTWMKLAALRDGADRVGPVSAR
ncbi:MAG TPA: cobalamin-independent methionine synthase II family protein [Pusillimonas sp.]|uniref:cobalamin-independent methionine synthase II family protein n=1 Tax=Pusillimonas sp. TaxID=3040095 RepID=UPI002CA04B9D|nr:cobalamin-independent methionine synthase II family protein [Pusillimonas sp.]HUH88003.1 cobalamin-independent methionine synthase II family protein [Pusillimonas sp.]